MRRYSKVFEHQTRSVPRTCCLCAGSDVSGSILLSHRANLRTTSHATQIVQAFRSCTSGVAGDGMNRHTSGMPRKNSCQISSDRNDLILHGSTTTCSWDCLGIDEYLPRTGRSSPRIVQSPFSAQHPHVLGEAVSGQYDQSTHMRSGHIGPHLRSHGHRYCIYIGKWLPRGSSSTGPPEISS